MSPALLGGVLVTCLGAGIADLTLLNLHALPALYGAAAPVAPAPSRDFRGSPPGAWPRTVPETAEPRLAVANTPSDLASLWSERTASQATPLAAVSRPSAVRRPAPIVVLEFDSASHRVRSKALWTLKQKLADFRGADRITVVGHADASGPEELNEWLSAERAAVVVKLLVDSGVPVAHVRSEARGERDLLPQGNSRRVEIYSGASP